MVTLNAANSATLVLALTETDWQVDVLTKYIEPFAFRLSSVDCHL